MLILLAHAVAREAEDEVLADNVVYRPDLDRKCPTALSRALARIRPDVLIARRHVGAAAACAWREARPEVPLVAIATRPDTRPARELGALAIFVRVAETAGGLSDPDRGAFALAERTWTAATAAAERARRRARFAPATGASVAMVGGGIVNLVTALWLARAGYRIALYDSGPDPRSERDWREFGCTRGGDNARMFTLTEADNYHDKQLPRSGELNTLFDRPVSECGWRICDPEALSPTEVEWANQSQEVPPWLAREYTEDILLFNREARDAWENLMRTEPGLFNDVELRELIVRLYTDAGHFRRQVARQDRVGATRRVLPTAEVAERHPALAEACASGVVVGGIEVTGFTVNIHAFLARIVGLLEEAGVEFHWEQRVEAVQWDEGGVADALLGQEGLIRADHYVISPGAYAAGLLRGTTSDGTIHGVLGVWLTVPNVEPALAHSLKIARTGHFAEDANVTVARDGGGSPILIVGSGYGWTGCDPCNVAESELELLYDAVEDTTRIFFPRAHGIGQTSGTLKASRRMCVRPWTASCLGVFEIIQARGGGVLVVSGGHNTGGFTQSPAVANAVLAALRGDPHPMETLYHPARLRRFYERQPRGPNAVAQPSVVGG